MRGEPQLGCSTRGYVGTVPVSAHVPDGGVRVGCVCRARGGQGGWIWVARVHYVGARVQ
jgi:hypothetical protein